MANCSDEKLISTRDTRTFLIHRDTDTTCGWKERRTRCQFVEQDGVERTIRGDITEQFAWQMDYDDHCIVGEIEDTPATVTGTLRLRERCAAGKIPFADTLGRCILYSVTNVGPCDKGNGILNWSGYQKIACLQLISQTTGKISSFDRSDEPIVHEFSARQLDLMTISTVNWAEIDITDMAGCDAGDLQYCMAEFGCRRGCGESKCGCGSVCDDGTNTMYVPNVCVGSNFQQLSYSLDRGATFKTQMLPVPGFDTDADNVDDLFPAVSTCPKICMDGKKIYMLGHMNPPVLFESDLDTNGNPEGWSVVAALGTANPTGTPAGICCDDGAVHMLVQDTANGSRIYRYGGGSTASDILHTFDAAADMSGMFCCDDIIYVFGANGSLEASFDGGYSWSAVVVPDDALTARITGVDNSQGWLKITTDAGQTYYSKDEGATWDEVILNTTSINHLAVNGGTGWMSAAGGAPFSTWVLGGLDNDWWTRSSPRQKSWPADYTAQFIDIPECSEEWLKHNAVMAVATDGNGDPHLMVGRPQVG